MTDVAAGPARYGHEHRAVFGAAASALYALASIGTATVSAQRGEAMPLVLNPLVVGVLLRALTAGVLAFAVLRHRRTAMVRSLSFFLAAMTADVAYLLLNAAELAAGLTPAFNPVGTLVLMVAVACLCGAIVAVPYERTGHQSRAVAALDVAISVVGLTLLYRFTTRSLPEALASWDSVPAHVFDAVLHAEYATVLVVLAIRRGAATWGSTWRDGRALLRIGAALLIASYVCLDITYFVWHNAGLSGVSLLLFDASAVAFLCAAIRLAASPSGQAERVVTPPLDATLSPVAALSVAPVLVMAVLAAPEYGDTAILVIGASGLGLLLIVRQLGSARRGMRQLAVQQRQLEHEVAERSAALREANRQLDRLSRQDGLTDLANRREFDARFAQAWHEAVRSHEPIGLALIDVDAFKAYNDRYGHQAGDSCLRTVGQALRGVLWRRTDLAARYGGEEFAVVLPSTTLEGAFRAAQRLRATVEALAIPHDASPVHATVTVSIGVAGCTPRGGDDPGELIAAADAALYEAKRNGRNQSRMADLPGAARATAP